MAKMRRQSKKIIRYKKPKNINIGVIVFAVIFVYLIIVLGQYIMKPKSRFMRFRMETLQMIPIIPESS